MCVQPDGKVQLKPINRGDAEIFRTIAFMARMKERHQDVRIKLAKAYEANPSDIGAALSFGIFNLLALETEDILLGKNNIENALAAFEHILSQEPGYWLVWVHKIRLLSMLPKSFRDGEELIAELKSLLELQKKSTYQPYFVLTYILLGEFYHTSGQKKEAQQYILEADSLPKTAVTILPDFLVLPLIGFESKLRMSGEIELANEIEKLGRTFFPGEYK